MPIESSKTSVVVDVNDRDVLFGRGRGIHIHEGNVRFRKLVATKSQLYKSHASDKAFRRSIAMEIIGMVQSKGGRFLKRIENDDCEETRWECVSTLSCLTKVKQALRDASETKTNPSPEDEGETTRTSASKSTNTAIQAPWESNEFSGTPPPLAQASTLPLRNMETESSRLNATSSTLIRNLLSNEQNHAIRLVQIMQHNQRVEALLEQRRQLVAATTAMTMRLPPNAFAPRLPHQAVTMPGTLLSPLLQISNPVPLLHDGGLLPRGQGSTIGAVAQSADANLVTENEKRQTPSVASDNERRHLNGDSLL